jgi:dGTP triphosphohydrolase
MMSDFSLVPSKIINMSCISDSSETHILVKDYITGMTDQFALDLYDKLQ